MKKILDYIQNHFLFTVLIILGFNLIFGHYFHQKNIIFHEADVNPLLVSAYIIAAYYGFQISLITGLIYSATYIFILHRETDFSNIETINTIHHLTVPISIIIFTPIIGQLKQLSLNRIQKLEQQMAENKKANKILKESQDLKEREIQDLKKKLVSKLDTVNSLYNDSKLFSTMNEDELIFNYFETLKEVTHIDSAILFKKDNKGDFNVCLKSGGHPEVLTPHKDLKHHIIIKKAMNDKKIKTLLDLNQEELLHEKKILLCRPITNQENEVMFILVVLEMNFINYTYSNFKLIDIYSEWVTNSLHIIKKATNHEETELISPSWRTYSKKYCEKICQNIFELSDRLNLPTELLKVEVHLSDTKNYDHGFIYNKCLTEFFLKNTPFPSFVYKDETNSLWYLFLIGEGKDKSLKMEQELKGLTQDLNLPLKEKRNIALTSKRLNRENLSKEGFYIV